MIELLVATTNQGKMREIRELLKDFDLKITSLADYPDAPKVVEDGKSFFENALKKAATIALYTKKLTLGEDSGLQVKALHNAPGIYSARFSGENATDRKNNLKLIRSLKKIPLKKRQARYVCCAVLVDGKGIIDTVTGTCGGLIAKQSAGKNGFGYDPYFFLPRYGKTFGQLDPAMKAKISHRARAFKKLKVSLKDYLQKYSS
jgi:XTP/dITP diphosphohydrolase